ncbi:MAG: Gfo/Idh/MocA family oxidoreductase [Verrucomicrobia bacterium]|nr:Gfo/Idh/MocA family oxidoreductase [Verrucomicrobiota bacterium]
MHSSSNRRDFLKTLGVTGAAMAAGGTLASQRTIAAEVQAQASATVQVGRPAGTRYMGDFAAPKLETVRWGVIGVGARGSGHAQQLAQIEGSQVVAISDLYEDWAKNSGKAIEKLTKKAPDLYFGSPTKYHEMLARPDIDAVIIATPWEDHAHMAIEAMKAGKHAFSEVPLGLTIDQLWEVINTSEQTGKHCMMMENCNYGREELLYLNICRQGVLGELLHGEAAYLHELRGQMHEVERGTGSWRTKYYSPKNCGNLYPTHGLGPVAQYMSIARTDDLCDRVVSFSTQARGRAAYAKANFPPDHKWNRMEFAGGDLSTQIIKTRLGRTIMVQWSETNPRPYSRHNLITGTKGTLAGYPERAAIEGRGSYEDWMKTEDYAKLCAEFEHPLWKRMGTLAEKMGGHGGMDFIMRCRMVECLRNGQPLDQNLYEGALWSAVHPLSAQSEKDGGAPQVFPDFTRGDWKNTRPLGIIA